MANVSLLASSPAPDLETLIAVVGRLGAEKFAPRAAQHDRDATFPFENYADMREAGLLKLCVPARHGGLGADFRTYCLVAAEMGRYDGDRKSTRLNSSHRL